MTSALEIASLFGVLELRDNATGALRGFDNLLSNTGQRLQSLGSGMQSLGAGMTAVAAPAVAALAIAGSAALDFGSSMTDVGSVLGRNQAEMAALTDEILAFSEDTRAGPQAVAESFYDIVGGVADASTHMAILEESVATAEAGNANLTATTAALIGVMNSYGFSADQASFASDVLTRTVGMGVGTMEQFAGALPNVTGLAASMGIEFNDLAAAAAFLTTKGNTAAEATTQLGGMMSALLNPNERMRQGLQALGFESGRAAVAQLGLVGTYEALMDEVGVDAMGPLVGQMEALRGVTALTEEGFEEFSNTFTEGIDGATAAARAIQMEAPAAQLDLLRSQLAVLSIEVGNAFIPALVDLVEMVNPVIDSILAWVRENPELVAQIAMLVGGLAVAGPVLLGVGTVISGIGAAITFLLSPIGLVIAAVAALAAAYVTNFGGIRDFIDTEVRPRLEDFFNFLEGVWERVRPAFDTVAAWFTTSALPQITDILQNSVMPLMQEFWNYLAGVWEIVAPALEQFWNWFMAEGLPGILNFVSTVVLPGIEMFINLIRDVWAVVSPALLALLDWFINTGLPTIIGFVNDTVMPGLQAWQGVMAGIWNIVRPPLTQLYNWFRDRLSEIEGFIQDVIDKFNEMTSALGSWGGVGDNANTIGAGLTSGAWNIGDVFNAAAGAIGAEFRDTGGPGSAGEAYMIGSGAQPEMFIPNTDGYFIPNADRMMDGGVQVGSVVIYANSRAEGAAAADGFMQRMDELRRRRG
jgi:TP901 family phage tail tape measure protein